MEEYLNFAIEIAYYAGGAIKEKFLKDKKSEFKSDRTIVTEVDKNINAYLIEEVKKGIQNIL